MLLESFKANTDAGYVLVPYVISHHGYLSYNFAGMTPAEIEVWKLAVTIPQVRKAHPETSADYLRILQNLGIRAVLAAADSCPAIRAEYHSKPLSRRMK